MSADPESMARVLANTVRINREDQMEDVIQGLVDLGAADDLTQLKASVHEWQESEWIGRYPNPVDGVATHLAGEVLAAMAELTDQPERLARVCVVTLNQERVTARLRPLRDGSALVYFSDATFTLCYLYAGCAADGVARLHSGRRLRDLWRMTRAGRTNSMGTDRELLGGLLRYYLVNQRVYALAAKLGHQLTADAEDICAWLTGQAVSFVLGHEIAHHALDHSPAESASSPADDLSACTLSERKEFEADLLGYRAAVRVGTETPVATPALGAALGALIGMLAIHVTEQGLFIRRGRSHPPAPARAARLLNQFSDPVRQFAELFLADLLAATRQAADFSPTGRPFDAGWFSRTRQVNSPQPPHYLQAISLLDRLQCRSREQQAASLAVIDEDSPVPLAEGTRAGLAGDARAALLEWDVPGVKVDELCSLHRALEFSTLVRELRESFKARGVPKESLLAGSVIAAQLLAQPLS